MESPSEASSESSSDSTAAPSRSHPASARDVVELPTPDARPGSALQIVVALLAGCAAILPVWAVWAAVSRPEVDDVIVRLNAPDDAFVYVRADVDGVFQAAPGNSFPRNSVVHSGVPLGSIQTSKVRRTMLQAEIRQLRSRIKDLQRQRLVLFPNSPTEEAGQSAAIEREYRDISQKIAELESRQTLLEEELNLNTLVVVPPFLAAGGRVDRGVPGSANVDEGDVIVPIWPENERLQVEIEGPQSVVLPLVERQSFNVQIYTTCRLESGARRTARISLPVEPDPATLSTYVREREGLESKIWAKLQCRPQRFELAQDGVKSVDLFPGLVGTLAGSGASAPAAVDVQE